MSATRSFGFTKLDDPDISRGGYSFSDRDRDVLDVGLYSAVTGHKHDAGQPLAAPAPPQFTIVPTESHWSPDDGPVWYSVSTVTEDNQETSASTPMAFANPFITPPKPTGVAVASSTPWAAGEYWFKVSLWIVSNEKETAATEAVVVSLDGTTKPQISFPAVSQFFNTYDSPWGFNLYVQLEGSETGYTFLTSASGTASFGDVPFDEATTRLAPTTYKSDIGVVAMMDDLLPHRLYRTIKQTDWSSSLISDDTSDGVFISSFLDDGHTPTVRARPKFFSIHNPQKVDLLTESVGAVPSTLRFEQAIADFYAPGAVLDEKVFTWVCPFRYAQLKDVSATLPEGVSPATAFTVDAVGPVGSMCTVTCASDKSGRVAGAGLVERNDRVTFAVSNWDGTGHDLNIQARFLATDSESW